MVVVAKIAQTLDGKIATANGESKWITSQKARDFARRRRDQFDAILVGINTAVKDNPRLTGFKKKLIKIVVDSKLTISPSAQLFRTAGSCILAVTPQASAKRIKFFEDKGVTVCVCRARAGKVDLKDLLSQLTSLGIKKLLIEGGARMVSAALRDNIVDQLNIYIAPSIMGDEKAISSISGLGTKRLNKMINLEKMKITHLSPDILIEAAIARRKK